MKLYLQAFITIIALIVMAMGLQIALKGLSGYFKLVVN